MQRPIKASVTGLMILTALSAGCAKKEDRAAQAATRAEQAAARAESAARRAESEATRVETAAQRAEDQAQLRRVAEPMAVHSGAGVLGDLEAQHRPGAQRVGQPGAGAHRPDPVGDRAQLPGHRRLRRPDEVGLGLQG